MGPESRAGTHTELSRFFTFTFHIESDLAKVSKLSASRVVSVSGYFEC